MNLFIATGRLVKDNELRMTATGKEVLQNTIAVKREFKNANGEIDSDFINIVLYGSTAKYISDYAPKGSLIEIVGRWQHRSYLDNQGNTRYVDECVVEKASILISNNQQNNEPKASTIISNDQQDNKPAAKEEIDPFYNETIEDNPFEWK